MNRRSFIGTSLAVALAANLRADDAKRAPRILLRSSWQTVNIGDIAHTPGVLALLEKHIPNAEVQLWPSSINNGVEELLKKRFPKLVVIEKTPEGLKKAFEHNDFLLHGSGPSLVAASDVAKWRKEANKPYGVYCITVANADEKTIDLLNGAKFVFFRDSVSMKNAIEKGLKVPIAEFGPDGAFATDLRNDAAASAFMQANGLEDGKFLCCIPRLRTTPYWKIHGKEMSEKDKANHANNEKWKEHDHAQLRAAIVAVLKETQMKVLLCPEDQSQMDVGKELLFDPLPAELKSRVVWREKYWLTDEALSTYLRSAGLFGNEMHSPIMCIGNGIPAVVCRWHQQTSKGFMWRDIGLGEWLFDMDDEASIPGIVPAVLAIAKDPAAAKEKAARGRAFVEKRQRETMAILAKEVGA